MKENRIADPAPKIGKVLADDLRARYGLSVNGQAGKKADTADMAEIVKEAAGSDYALDVVTNGWSFIYDGFHFSDYHVGCSVKMRLIDMAGAKAISEGLCAYSTKSAGKPPRQLRDAPGERRRLYQAVPRRCHRVLCR